MIIYTDFLIPKRFSGMTYGPIALIRPKCRDDIGLIEHEKIHIRQFWKLPFIHGLRYKFSRSYRLKCEIAAYREQMKHYSNDQSAVFAKMIVEKYDLDISEKEALRLLTA